jgi:hypothetical protein
MWAKTMQEVGCSDVAFSGFDNNVTSDLILSSVHSVLMVNEFESLL